MLSAVLSFNAQIRDQTMTNLSAKQRLVDLVVNHFFFRAGIPYLDFQKLEHIQNISTHSHQFGIHPVWEPSKRHDPSLRPGDVGQTKCFCPNLTDLTWVACARLGLIKSNRCSPVA